MAQNGSQSVPPGEDPLRRRRRYAARVEPDCESMTETDPGETPRLGFRVPPLSKRANIGGYRVWIISVTSCPNVSGYCKQWKPQ